MVFINALLKRVGMACPIIQAPMAGGGDTPELVAAVSNTGALGCFGAAYSTPEQILQTGAAIRARTDRPFGVNLFAPLPTPFVPVDITAAVERVRPYYRELSIEGPPRPAPPAYSLEQQIEAALEIGANVFSFTFNALSSETVGKIKERGLVVLGTATTVDEAIVLANSGVDGIIAQGAEAGGHRGTFATVFEAAMIGTIALVPQIVDAVALPVIASGGIMDGRGIAAALALGASAVQMGTAFLTCTEAGIPECYKTAILAAHEDHIVTTGAFSGRPARGIGNRFMREMQDASGHDVLPFPLQNALTRPMRQAAAKQGRADLLSLWAGQGVRMARRQTAAELVARLVSEIDEAMQRVNQRP